MTGAMALFMDSAYRDGTALRQAAFENHVMA